VTDRKGVVYVGRVVDMDPDKSRYARETPLRTLAEIVAGADIFLGLSAGGVLTPEMVSTMAANPVILALANPNPEILPELALSVRPDAIIATGRSDYPNQVNNALCFPYIFRGALDVGATTITEAMKLACVQAIAKLAREGTSEVGAAAYGGEIQSFGRDCLIPQPFDPRLLVRLAPAVAQAAMDSGVARRPIADMDAYRQKLDQFIFRTGLMMKPVFDAARREPKRVVFAEGEEEGMLRAVQNIVDEGFAKPILIGRPAVIEQRISRLGLWIKPGVHFDITNIDSDPRFNDYWQHYHRIMERRGVNPATAKAVVRSRGTVIGALMVERGEADAMIGGTVGRLQRKLQYCQDIVGLEGDIEAPAAMSAVACDRGTFFFLDTYVNQDPSAHELATATIMAVERLKVFGITAKVALLSHSNFGSEDSASSRKMRKVLDMLRQRAPELEVEGEMHADAAIEATIRERLFPNSRLTGSANMFVFPNLDAANICFNMVRVLTGGVSLGPIVMGLKKPCYILTNSATVRRIVNMTALAVVEAQVRGRQVEAAG
jgi:malate dehydrogenase (oxaloacetate-decarboxylating)(NADP+)